MPGYMCVVPNCKSGSKVPAHVFPKDPVRALQWKQAVNSPRLDGLSGHELKKFHVCALHFKEDDVIPSLVRRKLKQDAIPSLLLPKMHTPLQEEIWVDLPEHDTALNLQQEDEEAEAGMSITKRRRKNY